MYNVHQSPPSFETIAISLQHIISPKTISNAFMNRSKLINFAESQYMRIQTNPSDQHIRSHPFLHNILCVNETILNINFIFGNIVANTIAVVVVIAPPNTVGTARKNLKKSAYTRQHNTGRYHTNNVHTMCNNHTKQKPIERLSTQGNRKKVNQFFSCLRLMHDSS